MTVSELIECLQKFDPYEEVAVVDAKSRQAFVYDLEEVRLAPIYSGVAGRDPPGPNDYRMVCLFPQVS